MKIASLTDSGKRANNEDSLAVTRFGDIYLLAVADGLGGHSAGEIASGLAVIELEEAVNKGFSEGIADFRMLLQQAFEKTNREIYSLARENPDYSNMGTTLVAALIEEERCVIANIGDSRAYLIGEEIKQQTKDHSFVQELVDRGIISEEEAFDHPEKNIITRVMGTDADIKPDLYEIRICGQYLLLCSDGLTDSLRGEEIRRIIISSKDLDEACEKLINSAKETNGRDNITVILATQVDRLKAEG
ncbi:Stp1/IreP family PP2C-type Ser/Thr phosphatase [Dehalococcoidia bacterium]|nr:Stp1/IreP family PP2C-type Ser/Thr phosphatase [Dehalococcoidia bacterium]